MIYYLLHNYSTSTYKMAAIDLSGFTTYSHTTDGPNVLAGGHIDPATGELVLSSIPLKKPLLYPTNGLFVSYGRDIVSSQSEARLEAKKLEGCRIKTINFRLEVGAIYTKFVSQEILQKDGAEAIRFFTFQRATVDLQNIVFNEFKEYSKLSLQGADIIQIDDPIVGVAQRPELWEILLDTNPLFRNVFAVVIPVAVPTHSSSGDMRYIAYIHPRAAGSLLSVEMGIDPAKLRLPTWLTRVPVTASVTRDEKGFQAIVKNTKDETESSCKAKDLHKLAVELYRRGIDVASKVSGLDSTSSSELDVFLNKLGS